MQCVSSRSFRRSLVLGPAAFFLTGICLTVTGCAGFTTTAAPTGSEVSAGFGGSVFGGRQPIANATVRVYAAGSAGYGSAASLLATTTTNANGGFSFLPGSYLCPLPTQSTYSQTLYLTSTGGQPTTGVSNPNAVLMAVLGDCSTVLRTQPNVVMNEVTTVAGMFAMQQFFSINATSGAENFGTSSTNIAGLQNAAATVNNLVTLSSGFAITSQSVTGAITGYPTATPASITITPEATKLNTMADILAACVNSNGAATTSPSTTCGTLFSDVASPAVTDTLQAAYYLATNPTSTVSGTSNIQALYNTISAQSPYQSILTSAPTDWTLGITYGSNSSQTIGTSTTPTYLLTDPEYLGIDVAGNVWIANYKTGTANAIGNSVTELSPTGVPINQVLTAAGQVTGPKALILDPGNDVYVSNFGLAATLQNTVAEYSAGGATKIFTTGAGPVALASDGAGNVFLSTTNGTGGAATLEAIPANAATGTTSNVLATGSTGTAFSGLAVDGNETLYLTNATTGTVQYLCSQTTNTCAASPVTSVGGQTTAEPVAIDGSNNIWVGNYLSSTTGSLSEILAQANPGQGAFTGNGPFTGGGVQGLQKLLFDGAGNLWATSFPTTSGTLAEFSSAGTALSPAGGFAHNFKGALGLAIDRSGNLWIGNYNSSASGTTQAYINEVVGAAAPVVTPMSAELPGTPGNTTRISQRP